METNETNELIKKIIVIKNDPNFVSIKRDFEKKSLFNVLKIDNDENLHSNFLAWLFDPRETHELQQEPLLKLLDLLLLNALKQNDTYIGNIRGLQELLKSKKNIENIDVIREFSIKNGRIDIKISIENYNIIIENKIRSSESKGQTEKYINADEFKGKLNIYVFLRLPGTDKAKSQDFINVDYKELCQNVIIPLAELFSKNVRTKLFLDDYITTLTIPSPNDDSLIGYLKGFNEIKGQLHDILSSINDSINKNKDYIEKESFIKDFIEEHKSIIREFIKNEDKYDSIKEHLGATISARVKAQYILFELIDKIIIKNADKKSCEEILGKLLDDLIDTTYNVYQVLSKEPRKDKGYNRYITKPLINELNKYLEENDLNKYLEDKDKLEKVKEIGNCYITNNWTQKNVEDFKKYCDNFRKENDLI